MLADAQKFIKQLSMVSTDVRFGALVHAVLGTMPLDGDADGIRRVTELQARTLGSTDEEVESAARVVQTVLALPILVEAFLNGSSSATKDFEVAR